MTGTAQIAAEFTMGGKRHPPILTITSIENGRRTQLRSFIVADKRDARKVAASNGAKPWNF